MLSHGIFERRQIFACFAGWRRKKYFVNYFSMTFPWWIPPSPPPPTHSGMNKQAKRKIVNGCRLLKRCVYKRTKYTTVCKQFVIICCFTCTHSEPIFTSCSQAIGRKSDKKKSAPLRGGGLSDSHETDFNCSGNCRYRISKDIMRSLITLTLLTTIQIVDKSLSSKHRDDLKQSDENNYFQFDESHEPSGDVKSQPFCEGNNDRCKVRSM